MSGRQEKYLVKSNRLFAKSRGQSVVNSFRLAAWWILFANVVDLLLTLRALKLGASEGNPISSFLINGHFIILIKIGIPACFLWFGYRNSTSRHLTEVSVRRAWFVAGLYFTVLIVGIITNLRTL